MRPVFKLHEKKKHFFFLKTYSNITLSNDLLLTTLVVKTKKKPLVPYYLWK